MANSNNNSTFVSFGSVRIKYSNIKNYGISTFKRYYKKVFVWEGEEFDDMDGFRKTAQVILTIPSILLLGVDADFRKGKYVWKGELNEIDVNEYEREVERNSDAYIEKTLRYLYVTTYQNENYQFKEDEVSFNIYKKMKELDSMSLRKLNK